MVINIKKEEKLDIKKIIISKIDLLIFTYMNQFDVKTIHLNYKIDGIHYFTIIPHYKDSSYKNDWYNKKGIALIQILKCLRERDFYGICVLQNGQHVKIIPKKPIK